MPRPPPPTAAGGALAGPQALEPPPLPPHRHRAGAPPRVSPARSGCKRRPTAKARSLGRRKRAAGAPQPLISTPSHSYMHNAGPQAAPERPAGGRGGRELRLWRHEHPGQQLIAGNRRSLHCDTPTDTDGNMAHRCPLRCHRAVPPPLLPHMAAFDCRPAARVTAAHHEANDREHKGGSKGKRERIEGPSPGQGGGNKSSVEPIWRRARRMLHQLLPGHPGHLTPERWPPAAKQVEPGPAHTMPAGRWITPVPGGGERAA